MSSAASRNALGGQHGSCKQIHGDCLRVVTVSDSVPFLPPEHSGSAGQGVQVYCFNMM
jgi:hypothetical protein